MPRTVDLSTETIELLKLHKRHQAELKMANRTIYRDHGLVFCREWGERRARKDFLGDPLQTNNLGEREFLRLIKAASVKRISIRGRRHTSATLLLKAGVPAHVVQQRLGHKRIEMTLGTYAHALPSMQKDAGRRLARCCMASPHDRVRSTAPTCEAPTSVQGCSRTILKARMRVG
jgi:integrase